MHTRRTIVSILIVGLAVQGFAQDAAGKADHPLVSRYRGSRLRSQSKSDYDQYLLPLGRAEVGHKFKKQIALEGAITRTLYTVGGGASIFAVERTYEEQLKRAGFQILYTCGGWDCHEQNRNEYLESVLHISGDGIGRFYDQHFVSAELKRPEGSAYVGLYVAGIEGSQDIFYQVDVIEPKPLDTTAVTVDSLASTIAASGRVAVYDIFFDTNQAVVKANSAPALAEIGKLMKVKPTLKILVVGHTDAVGPFAANMDLSQKRAAAVVEALVKQFGVDPNRLTPVGVGFAAPVATNSTEDGRARNRRVELVEVTQ
jgi:outer membrane protein OmpA-like peptidoglycan-associated protein